ncbi:MAG: hypothetical protein V2A34_16570 [Lentisphaerota bacterium]
MKKFFPACALVLFFLAASPALAERPWHELSLRGCAGSVFNAGKVDARDGYNSLSMGGDLQWGVGLILTPDNAYEFELAYSQWNGEGNQYSSSGASKIAVDLKNKQGSLTFRRKYAYPGMFVPWWGVGPDLVFLESTELETIQPGGDLHNKDMVERTYTGAGAHLCGGFDVYPVKYSSLALSVEARYSYYAVGNSFIGDINGFAAFIGLRWDFWQHSNLD